MVGKEWTMKMGTLSDDFEILSEKENLAFVTPIG